MAGRNNNKLNPFLVAIAFIIPVVLQGLFVYFQIKNGILTFWNLFGTIFMFLIVGNGIRMAIHDKKKEDAAAASEVQEYQGETTVEMTGPERNVKFTIIQAIAAIVAIACSVLCFKTYDAKSTGLNVVTADVVAQWGETVKETEIDDEGEITQTETEHIEVTIRYEYNGVYHQEVVKANTTSKIYVDEIKVYVDGAGKLVDTYGRVEIWKYEAIILMVFGVIMAFTAMFVLGAGFIAGDIMTCLGAAIFMLVASPFIEDILYNDILCFIAIFVNIGLYMLLFSVFTLVFVGRKGLAGAITTTTTYVDELPDLAEEVDEEYDSQDIPELMPREEPVVAPIYCRYCGNEIAPGANFCDMCGARLTAKEIERAE